jgi:AcrR family transcriptional regulator
MEQIAKALNRAKSSIYYYFTSKEDIYSNIIEKESLEMSVELDKSVEKALHPYDKLKAYILTRVQIIQQLRNLRIALEDHNLANYPFIQQLRDDQINREIEKIKEILSEGVAANQLEIENVDDAASAIFFSLRSIESFRGIKHRLNTIKFNLDTFLEMIFKGIGKQPAYNPI